MREKKIRFNLIDVIVLMLILAFGISSYFMFYVNKKDFDDVKIRYVIQINKLDSVYSTVLTVGESVISSDYKKTIGVLAAYDTEIYNFVGTTQDGGEVKTPVEDYVNLYLTVEADAKYDGDAYKANEVEIGIGKEYKLAFPELSCSGSCISVEVIEVE